jgi:hypothetical protein
MDLGKHKRSLTVVPVTTEELDLDTAVDEPVEEAAKTRED